MNKITFQSWLMLFRENLRAKDADSLAKNVESASLNIILAQEFEDLVCEEDARQVAVLIGSVGENNTNTHDLFKYNRLKNAYQCLTGQIEISIAAKQCSAQNSKSYDYYKILLESINNSREIIDINKVFATTDDFDFGIKILINTGNCNSIFAILKKWQSLDNSDLPWLKTCKYIIKKGEKNNFQLAFKKLALACKKLIDQAPIKQMDVKKQMIGRWANYAYNSKDSNLARTATEAAIKIDSGFEHLILYSKALILYGDLAEASRSFDALIFKVTSEDRKIFLSKYDTEETGSFDYGAAENTLKDANKVLRANGLKPFLVAGTLLGYAREGEILKHDKDVDIGIIGWEDQFTAAQALLETGFFQIDLKNITGSNRYTIPVTDLRNGTALDIFLFHNKDDHYLYGIDFDIGYTLNFKFNKFNLQEVNFLGDIFYAPANIDQHLQENYGDWETPIPGYVVPIESPAIVKSPEAYKLTTYIEIFKNIIEAKNHKKVIRIIDYINANNIEYISIKLKDRIVKWCKID